MKLGKKQPQTIQKAVLREPAGKYVMQNKADHTTETNAVQHTLDNRPEVKQFKQVQQLADQSTRTNQAVQLQQMADQHSLGMVQLQHISEEEELPVQKKSNHTGLPDQLKSGIENLSGYGMDDVKVHYNSSKPAQLQALAYAQGSDIHLGPGQEKHLPHEAWHVVQQKQGRVQPTLQMKTGVSVNDEEHLEQEADVMGEKAVQGKWKTQATGLVNTGKTAVNSPVQRYEVKKASENGKVYAVSTDKKMVSGMGTPNHELYVAERDAIEAINQVIGHSPLEVYEKGTLALFGATYFTVGLRFKTKRKKNEVLLSSLEEENPWLHNWSKKNLKTTTTDLHKIYTENIVPGITSFREGIMKEKALALNSQTDKYKLLAVELKKLTDHVNLFKKIVTAELASVGAWNEDVKGMAGAARSFIVVMEKLLHDPVLTKAKIGQVIQELLELWFDEINEVPVNLIDEVSQQILQDLKAFDKVYPSGKQVNMLELQSFNFQKDNLESLSGEDAVMLYRACDVTSATLLGNKITQKNQQQSKVYKAETGSAFHFATKVLSSGSDWISLEGFAASDIERKIAGTDKDDTVLRNIDNTWQFIMQGNTDGADDALSQDDNYFALYTKIRYYLKGIHEEGKGGFDTQIRRKLGNEASKRTIAKGLAGDMMNAKAWEAFYKGSENASDLQAVLDRMVENDEGHMDPTVAGHQNWDSVISKTG